MTARRASAVRRKDRHWTASIPIARCSRAGSFSLVAWPATFAAASAAVR